MPCTVAAQGHTIVFSNNIHTNKQISYQITLFILMKEMVAQWIRRSVAEREKAGSIPGRGGRIVK